MKHKSWLLNSAFRGDRWEIHSCEVTISNVRSIWIFFFPLQINRQPLFSPFTFHISKSHFCSLTFNSWWVSALVSALLFLKHFTNKVVDDDHDDDDDNDHLQLFLKCFIINKYSPLTEPYQTGRRNEPTPAWVRRATSVVPSLQPLFLI